MPVGAVLYLVDTVRTWRTHRHFLLTAITEITLTVPLSFNNQSLLLRIFFI